MLEIPESDRYQTIAAPATGSYKEKGSKFLAFAYPVSTEGEIKELLAQIKKEYYDAKHHCFAFRLGPNGTLWRAYDDREPSFSAGKPILDQMRSANVSDVLIVVVRYMKGTKLGIPRLTNAYRQAAADALGQSVLVTKSAVKSP